MIIQAKEGALETAWRELKEAKRVTKQKRKNYLEIQQGSPFIKEPVLTSDEEFWKKLIESSAHKVRDNEF